MFTHSTGSMWLRDDGILQVRINKGVELTREDVAAYMTAARALYSGKLPLLIDRRNSYSQAFSAQQEMEGRIADFVTALAYLVASPMGRLVAEWNRANMPSDLPVAVFTSEEEAVRWLRQYPARDS